ncbi:E3 ubiquitin-protein ligase BRE1-like 2 [Galdieria sulphuraria]|nr:E3 ubiquitin-protein ligase BRE1-like 2 [Galdieria sulphuraria]
MENRYPTASTQHPMDKERKAKEEAEESDSFFDASIIKFQKYQLVSKVTEQESEIKRLRKQNQELLLSSRVLLPTLEKWRERLTKVIKQEHTECNENQVKRSEEHQVLVQIQEELEVLWNNTQTKSYSKVAETTVDGAAVATESSKIQKLEAETSLLREEMEELKVERSFLGRQLARLRYQLDNMVSSQQEAEKSTAASAALKKEEEESAKTEDSTKEQELLARCKDAEALADSRLKELQEALEERKKLVVEWERLKSERLVATDDVITQSAVYCSLKAAFEKLQLQQIEWEKEKDNLKKEKEELERVMEEKYGLQIQRWKRRASEWKQQLEDAIHATKKLEAENDSQIESLRRSLTMWETKGQFLEQEKQHLEKQVEDWKQKTQRLEENVLKEIRDRKLVSNEIVEQLRHEIEDERKKSDELIGEIESLSNMFRDVEDSNRNYMNQLMEKDEQISKLSTERLKQRQQIISLTEYKKTMQVKAKSDEERIAALENSVQAAKRHGVEIQNVNNKLNEELRTLSAEVDRLRKVSEELGTKARQAEVEKEEMKRMRDVTVRRLEEVVNELQSQRYEKKRLEELKSRLEDKCQRLESMHMAGESELLRDELIQELRKKLYCSVYTNLPKDCVLLRCGHLFSRQCITDLITQRNRKCPVCGDRFGTEDYRPVYF